MAENADYVRAEIASALEAAIERLDTDYGGDVAEYLDIEWAEQLRRYFFGALDAAHADVRRTSDG